MINEFHLVTSPSPTPTTDFYPLGHVEDIASQSEIFGYLPLVWGKGNGELISSLSSCITELTLSLCEHTAMP